MRKGGISLKGVSWEGRGVILSIDDGEGYRDVGELECWEGGWEEGARGEVGEGEGEERATLTLSPPPSQRHRHLVHLLAFGES